MGDKVRIGMKHLFGSDLPVHASSQRHWVSAQLGYVPVFDTVGIALRTALISEGMYLSGYLGCEVTVDEIEAAEPGAGRRE